MDSMRRARSSNLRIHLGRLFLRTESPAEEQPAVEVVEIRSLPGRDPPRKHQKSLLGRPENETQHGQPRGESGEP